MQMMQDFNHDVLDSAIENCNNMQVPQIEELSECQY